LWVIFALLDPDPDSEYGSGSTGPIKYGSNPDPEPCLVGGRNPVFVLKMCALWLRIIGCWEMMRRVLCWWYPDGRLLAASSCRY
jgi:hypothetical protein